MQKESHTIKKKRQIYKIQYNLDRTEHYYIIDWKYSRSTRN